MLTNLKFRYLQNDRPVHLLVVPNPTFGGTKFYTRPYKSSVGDQDVYNVLIAYSKKHECDLAQISAAARGEMFVESRPYDLESAKHVAACLSMPLLVLIDSEPQRTQLLADKDADASNGTTSLPPEAYFYDPKRKPSDFRIELRNTLRKSLSS